MYDILSLISMFTITEELVILGMLIYLNQDLNRNAVAPYNFFHRY